MPTLVLDPQPAAIERLLDERRRLGHDRHDEVWKGVLHVIPGPGAAHMRVRQQLSVLLGPLAGAAGLTAVPGINLGDADDYRIPDAALIDESVWGTYARSAALVVEIVSPGDETRNKLSFYAERDVDELVIIDPSSRTVEWLALEDGRYQATEHSRAIGLGPAELAGRLAWPPTP